MNIIWITWERHRRTGELAAALKDVQLHVLQLDAPRPIRYLWLLFHTTRLVLRRLPDLMIVQNPSLVLALFAATLGKVTARAVIVDAHNEGIKPFSARHNWLLPLYRFVQRSADLTIVTNSNLAAEVARNHGNPFVLEDSIPQFGPVRKIALQGRYNIVFVCTFEKDEPYAEVIASARRIDSKVCIYVTGRFQKAPCALVASAPPNVKFTGFLPDEAYADLLYSSDAVMDLTLMQDCLVCGAYEAVAMEKPMILSDTKALRGYFCCGAVYTQNDSVAIAEAVHRLITDLARLETEVKALKSTLTRQWRQKLNHLETLIHDHLTV